MSERTHAGASVVAAAAPRRLKPYLWAAMAAALLTVVLRGCAVQGFKVASGSMLPTLLVGDHVLMSPWAYGIAAPLAGVWFWRGGGPDPGDVVLLEYEGAPGSFFIKRVAAIAGETVEVVAGELVVDGQPREIAAPRLPSGTTRDFRALRVPPGQVFVLGDNRDRSIDSREWGPVELSGIKGRVFLIYWSQTKSGGSVRWERLFARVQ